MFLMYGILPREMEHVNVSATLKRDNKQTSRVWLLAETEAWYDSDMNNCGDNEDK